MMPFPVRIALDHLRCEVQAQVGRYIFGQPLERHSTATNCARCSRPRQRDRITCSRSPWSRRRRGSCALRSSPMAPYPLAMGGPLATSSRRHELAGSGERR
jgi:hypothetical protein